MADLSLDPALLDAPDGPVVIVAAGRLQEAEFLQQPHRHARGQLFGSLRGLLSVGVEGALWVVPAIHAVWLPPRLEHSARSHGPFEGWSVFVAESACDSLPPRPCTLRVSGLLREAVQRASGWPPGPLDAAAGHVAAVILDEIRSLPVEAFGLPLPRDPRLLRIARALIADPADARGLEDWASWAAVSVRTLSRRFVLETGFNFSTWRQRVRLLRALELLAVGEPVTAIALTLGYATPTAFITLFKRTFGATPAAYRARPATPGPGAGLRPRC
ncbi:helix-turn-helix transcriptional regulator [Mitsuaria sp. GD03876]|uniref:AraC family transcriptional regulator n=1 Tax=Mitsuaria sp. GD03876 TaxID=2975399 RepID=UPI002447BCF0|nr:helix-turn-helix transcriptional regulator [Mitsuaria sp. GD03876]MDH0863844.1 helix-turn-helix transcriptional regulator [Mitsuaria sp. GD03876]